MTIKAGIFGATGYTGLELVRLLAAHPEVELVFATSESTAGQSLRTSWPQAPDITLISASEAEKQNVQCVFLCLPHTQSAMIAAKALALGIRVIDLSADLRLRDVKVYEHWYGVTHPAPELLPVPYGLPELGREALVSAKVIANPGCYATATVLGLAPVVRHGLLDEHAPIIVDAKSGVTGAGRTPKLNILYGEVHGNLSPYNIGRAHRHIPEIEQALSDEGLDAGRLIFSPHLLPTDRGILATLYLQVKDIKAAQQAYRDIYENEPLVHVLPKGELATLGHVVRTPHAVLSLTPAGDHMLIVVSVLDNLLKGAASQAAQNFNLMWDLPETMGLITNMHDKVTA